MFDMFGILDKVNKLKVAATDIRLKMENTIVEATSTDGLVVVKTTATKKVTAIEIDPSLASAENIGKLNESVLEAVNEALKKAGALNKEEMKKGTEGLIPNIPGLDLSKFLG